MKGSPAAVVVFLSLLSLGRLAVGSDCDSLLKPITVSNEEILGQWMYIGGSSDLPGSRSVSHLMTSVSLNLTATGQTNVLSVVQTLKTYDECSRLTYNVTFENSMMKIDQPFSMKEVYLPTDCSDCLVAHKEIITSLNDKFTSLLLFSRRKSIEPGFGEKLRKQAECLQMPTPIMTNNTDDEICSDDVLTTGVLHGLKYLLESKMAHLVFRLLDKLFDWFVN